MKKVVLRFTEYNITTELYSVTAELWHCNERTGDEYQVKLSGQLPSVKDLFASYQEWHQYYQALLQIIRESRAIEIEPGIQNVSEIEFESLCQNLRIKINNWLNDLAFSEIKAKLYAFLHRDEEILVAIETDDEQLWRLPWHLWDFFDTFHRAEVILSNLKFIRLETQKQRISPWVKVLIILGDSSDIDLDEDLKLWQKLWWRWTKYELIPKPQRQKEITDRLVQKRGLDILFFAGHSRSDRNCTTGTLYINENYSNNSITINALEKSLRKAVRNGLQLSIFNSCDGIGLARRLLDYNMPRIVVMREKVPNKVAQEFLKHFLREFSSGQSLPVALRNAREKLEDIEDEFLCATWLPVLCQNSATSPLTWQMMRQKRKFRLRLNSIVQVAFGFFLATILHWILQQPTPPPPAYLTTGISLGEEILIQNKMSPEKEAGRKAFEDKDYKTAMSQFQNSLESNPNDPEARIYFNNTKAIILGSNPVKIAVSVPIGSNREVAEEILRGVALAQEEINNNQTQMPKINGNLQVVIANDNNDKYLAPEVAKKFVKDSSILAVVGHNASNASEAAMSIYIAGQLVAITPTSFADSIRGNSYIFRMVPQITYFAAQVAYYIDKKITNPKLVLCFDPDAPDNQDFKQKVQQILNANRKMTIDIPCKFLDPGFAPNSVVDAIQKNNANSLLVSTHVDRISKAIEVFKAVRNKQLKINLFGSPTLYTDRTIELGKEAVEGIIFSVPYYPSPKTEFSVDSYNLWQAKTSTWRTAMSYDATNVILTGLEQILEQKQEPIRQNLDRILRDPNFKYQGVVGSIEFNPGTGERNISAEINKSDAIIQIQKGNFVKIE
jgi:branched-chain amino acid transport system substrate-binding protein